MKHIPIILLLIPLLFGACQSKTYYQAMNTNQQRFGGWELENARFLSETNDQVKLIELLSNVALERTILKETYFVAQQAHPIASDLKGKYRLEAAKRRIKLSSMLSEPSDAYLQKLDGIQDQQFDVVYIQYMQEKISELNKSLNDYIENGKNERLIEFSKSVKDSVEPIAKTMDNYSAPGLKSQVRD